ncbi:MAG: hypothetical protein ACI4SW_00915, partial [Thermoguttaceae bacterium]
IKFLTLRIVKLINNQLSSKSYKQSRLNTITASITFQKFYVLPAKARAIYTSLMERKELEMSIKRSKMNTKRA